MPTIGSTVQKDPNAQKVYAIDWSAYLAGATIASSLWIISGPDSTLTKDNESNTTTATQLRLSGGTVGKKYTVTNRITQSGSPQQTDERSFCVRVVEL